MLQNKEEELARLKMETDYPTYGSSFDNDLFSKIWYLESNEK